MKEILLIGLLLLSACASECYESGYITLEEGIQGIDSDGNVICVDGKIVEMIDEETFECVRLKDDNS